MPWTAMDPLTLTVLVTLLILVPLYGVWDFKRLQRRVASGDGEALARFYAWTLVTAWGLTAVFGLWWILNDKGLAQLRLRPAAEGWQWLAIGLGLAGAAFVVWQMFKVVGDSKELDKVRGKIGHLQDMVPTTSRESRLFDAASITAGVCEEFLYRGILLVALTALIGLWPAVVVSSVIFGLGHSYQGPGGILKTSLVGLFLAVLTVFSGSLFIPMLLHAVIDLTSGRIMAASQKVAAAEPAQEV